MANKNVKNDCRFAKQGWEKNICNGCMALKDMYCKNDGKCAFYKPKTSEYGSCKECEFFLKDAHEKVDSCINKQSSLLGMVVTSDFGCNQFRKKSN